MAAATTTSPELTLARRAMACDFSITIPAARHAHIQTASAALDEIDRLEAALSAYLDTSEISLLNRRAALAPVTASPETYRLLRFAARLAEATRGAFDPAAGALVHAWGFHTPPRRIPTHAELAAALEASGYRNLLFHDPTKTISFLHPNLRLNLGAIGKGFALDTAAALLSHRHGLQRALLQCGQSSFYALGAPPREPAGWKIALAHPCNPQQAIAHITLRDRALGTSGAAHQFFTHNGRRFGHILDPRSGRPAHRLLSATAIAPTAAEADALSTAFYVLGIDATRDFLLSRPRLGAILVRPNPAQPSALEITQLGAAPIEVLQ
jgi:thiamine biosynthesis lipoprotein